MPMTENNFISFWNKADKGENADFKAWNAKVGLTEQWKKNLLYSLFNDELWVRQLVYTLS